MFGLYLEFKSNFTFFELGKIDAKWPSSPMPITDKFLFFLIILRNLFFILGLRKFLLREKIFLLILCLLKIAEIFL